MGEETNTEQVNIPEVVVEGDKVILPTCEVPIKFNGKDSRVIIQKISGGQRRNAIGKHISTQIRGQQIDGKIEDVVGIQISILAEVIVKAPFATTEKDLAKLPEDVLDYLYNQYEEWTKKKLK